MDRLPFTLRAAAPAIGTAFAWLKLVDDYRRYFRADGWVLERSGCTLTNLLLILRRPDA